MAIREYLFMRLFWIFVYVLLQIIYKGKLRVNFVIVLKNLRSKYFQEFVKKI